MYMHLWKILPSINLWWLNLETMPYEDSGSWTPEELELGIGRIRLSISTVNRTYELSGITHVTSFRKYGKHSTAPCTYGPWVRTYSKLFSCKSVLTVCSYRTQSNEIHTYGRVSRGSIQRVRRYGLLYLRTVEYDHWPIAGHIYTVLNERLVDVICL